MDKIWDRNPSKSEVIGRCGGDEKNEWSRRTNKSRTLKINYKNGDIYYHLLNTFYNALIVPHILQKGTYSFHFFFSKDAKLRSFHK